MVLVSLSNILRFFGFGGKLSGDVICVKVYALCACDFFYCASEVHEVKFVCYRLTVAMNSKTVTTVLK